MKPLQLFAACALCLLSGSVGASAQDVDVNRVDVRATRGAYRPGQVIVKFKSSSDATALRSNYDRDFRWLVDSQK
ncbi:MAG: hypothetical protein J1E63_05145 [Muribaculaceae bacterium]|nr:hypothetical protein [Muribaculaceae bacterium]